MLNGSSRPMCMRDHQLEYFGLNYLLNVIIGVVLAASINFVLYDRIVFNEKNYK